jgi:hypothetical protein
MAANWGEGDHNISSTYVPIKNLIIQHYKINQKPQITSKYNLVPRLFKREEPGNEVDLNTENLAKSAQTSTD